MPVVPTPPTITDGIVPSSTWNQFRDAIRWLEAPPIAELRQTSAQSVPNSTWTAITLDVEDVDTDIDGVGGHSTSVNTSRWTCRYPGWHELSGAVGFVVNGTGARGVKLQINGIDVNGSQVLLPTQSGFSNIAPGRLRHMYLAASDYVELLGFQSSGGALNTATVFGPEHTHMSVRWVSL